LESLLSCLEWRPPERRIWNPVVYEEPLALNLKHRNVWGAHWRTNFIGIRLEYTAAAMLLGGRLKPVGSYLGGFWDDDRLLNYSRRLGRMMNFAWHHIMYHQGIDVDTLKFSVNPRLIGIRLPVDLITIGLPVELTRISYPWDNFQAYELGVDFQRKNDVPYFGYRVFGEWRVKGQRVYLSLNTQIQPAIEARVRSLIRRGEVINSTRQRPMRVVRRHGHIVPFFLARVEWYYGWIAITIGSAYRSMLSGFNDEGDLIT